MEMSVLMGWIGLAVGILIGIPQLVKTIRLQSARDLSSLTYILLLVTCICFLVKSLAIAETVFICYYSFCTVLTLFQLFLIWKFRNPFTKVSLFRTNRWRPPVITAITSRRMGNGIHTRSIRVPVGRLNIISLP